MYPFKPDDLGHMPPMPEVNTLACTIAIRPGFISPEVEQRTIEFLDDLQPKRTVSYYLTRRAALLSVRLEDMERYHAAIRAQRLRRAESEYTQNRLCEIDHLNSWLCVEPAVYLRRLMQSPEGIDRLLASWEGLRFEITDPEFPRWVGSHSLLADHLIGRRPSDLPVSPFQVWTDAFNGLNSPYVNANPELKPLTISQRQVVAAERLVEIIDAEVAKLQAARELIDFAALEQDRLEATDRALFDPSPAAKLARSYESATERNLHKAFRTIQELESELEPVEVAESLFEPDAIAEPTPDLTPPPRELDTPFGKRSRRKVVVGNAARRVAEIRAEKIREELSHGSTRIDHGSDRRKS